MTNYDILKEYEEHQTPVPTYKEWEKLNWYAGNGVEENQELKMENAKLKELLKEIIADADLSYCDSDIELRIDEVLK